MPELNTAEWLCYFLRQENTASGSTGIPAGSETIDWPDLLRLAQCHGVAPLLYYRLTTSGIQENIPEHTFQTLHQAYLQSAARNTRENPVTSQYDQEVL